MTITDQMLWNAIERLPLANLGGSLSFRRRLARENAWSAYFADKAIIEYKKFVYLTQVSKTQMTPSFQVDQVWHLHMTYTQNYWNTFCPILDVPLHHGPTKGGGA